jgi:MoaD family protein
VEVEVKYYAMIRDKAGKKTEKVALPSKSSVKDLVENLIERYGDEFENYIYNNEKQVRDYLSFMLNGINVNSLDGFNTILRDGDTFSMLPPIGGG